MVQKAGVSEFRRVRNCSLQGRRRGTRKSKSKEFLPRAQKMSQERRSAMIGVGKNIGTVGKVHGKRQQQLQQVVQKVQRGEGRHQDITLN